MSRWIRGAVGILLMGLPAALAAASVQIAYNVPLSFGNIVSSPASGTVTVTSAGATTTTGGVVAFGGGSSPASFTITVGQGNPHYTIVLPVSTNLTGAGAPMRLDAFESTPGGGGHVHPPTGYEDMTMGATLHVGANQAAGTYSGTFDITVAAP